MSASGSEVDYTYSSGRLATIAHNTNGTAANDVVYSFAYDQFGNTSSVNVGSQALISHTYEANNGNLARSDYGNGDYYEPAYDAIDRLHSVSYNGVESFNWEYGADGRVGLHNDLVNGVTWMYEYSNDGSLISAVGDNGEHFVYTYEPSTGKLLTRTVFFDSTVTKTTTYNYSDHTNGEKANLIDSVVLPIGTVSYDYDDFYRASYDVEVGGSDILTTDYTFRSGSAANSTSLMVESMTNAGNGWSEALSYTYDANGNIETIRQNGTLKATYYYDSLNQLIREDDAWLNKTITYTYDNGGNILSCKEYAYTTGSLSGLTATSTGSYVYGDNNWKDKLTGYNGSTITYDAIGNPLSYYNGYTFDWQNGRQLASITGNGLTASYKYNADGIRTSKTVNGVTTKYTLDGSNVVLETNGTDTIWYYYDATGSLTGFELNGTAYFYVKNIQGDIVAITNASGTKVVEYLYDSWGKLISTTGSLASTVGAKNPYRYRGYRYDTETGLYYLQSRYYDPVVKRFINADGFVSTGQGILGNNMYAYCGNNPIGRQDSTGEYWWIIPIIIPLIFSGCSSQPASSIPRSDLINASDLDIDSASPDSYNCYGNAIGKQINTDPTGYFRGYSTKKTFEAVRNDLGNDYVRKLDSIDSPINKNEVKVALKCGPTDYHFIRLDGDQWYNKSGLAPGLYVDQSYVSGDIGHSMWMNSGQIYCGTTEYCYETIYFAVDMRWDEQ